MILTLSLMVQAIKIARKIGVDSQGIIVFGFFVTKRYFYLAGGKKMGLNFI